VDHGGESRITAGLKKYACFLTLDPNTAHTYLSLSEENKKRAMRPHLALPNGITLVDCAVCT
ncbi:hypothetical protein QQF64_018400, partial [Cirrhinus molitorella]